MHNIIIFGETGSGKSSLVNLVIGKAVAHVSNDASGCTFNNEFYETEIGDAKFRIYDTAGLNEGDQGRVPHWKAIHNLYTLIRELDGVSLLVYCLRGRIKENSKANWILFNKVICAEQVPIIAAVTGLEMEADPDDWWRRAENKESFKKHNMIPTDVACVVAVRFPEVQDTKYAHSQTKLRQLISESYRRLPWSKEKNSWFASIYETVYDTGICLFAKKRLDFVQGMRKVFSELFSEAGMVEEDSKKLMTALLDAEKKILKQENRKVKKQMSKASFTFKVA